MWLNVKYAHGTKEPETGRDADPMRRTMRYRTVEWVKGALHSPPAYGFMDHDRPTQTSLTEDTHDELENRIVHFRSLCSDSVSGLRNP